MPLVDRFTRLLTADFHALLDRVEEPASLLRQAVHDMSGELAAMHTRQRALQRDLQTTRASLATARERISRLDGELDLCLAAGKDQLARDLVRRKLEVQAALERATSREQVLAYEISELTNSIGDSEQNLAAMREHLLTLDEATGESAAHAAPVIHAGAISSEEIDIALLREKQRRAGA